MGGGCPYTRRNTSSRNVLESAIGDLKNCARRPVSGEMRKEAYEKPA